MDDVRLIELWGLCQQMARNQQLEIHRYSGDDNNTACFEIRKRESDGLQITIKELVTIIEVLAYLQGRGSSE